MSTPEDSEWPSDPREISARVSEIESALAIHPGHVASKRWRELSRSRAIHERNQNEIEDLLGSAEESEPMMLALMEDKGEPTDFQYDYWEQLDQRLLNVMSSNAALIDHTRRVTSKYPQGPFLNEYTRRKDEVATAPVAGFVKGFRNYLVHKGVAPIQQTLSFGLSKMSLKINLPVDTLRKNFDWSADAKSYLASVGESLHLRAAINEYGAMSRDLNEWLFGQFDVMHSKEVDQANELIRNINLLRTQGRYDGTEWPS